MDEGLKQYINERYNQLSDQGFNVLFLKGYLSGWNNKIEKGWWQSEAYQSGWNLGSQEKYTFMNVEHFDTVEEENETK